MKEYKNKQFDLRLCDNMELMAQYSDNYFDLAVVDPPYGISINVNMGRRKGDKKSNYTKFYGEDKNIPSSEYFRELFRLSKNQIIWGGNYMTDFLYPSSCWLLWDKGFSEDVTFAQFELAWSSFKSSAKKYDFNAARNRNRIHPTQKPVALYKWIFTNYAKQGDKILDTHLGSMSIAVAVDSLNKVEKMDLHLTGCEIDDEYFNKGIERLKRAEAQLSLF